MRQGLPAGTVTFLFTDVEGSTRLLREIGAEAYADALAEHRKVIRQACALEGGAEVDTQGDAFFFAFPTAPGAVKAAAAFTEALAAGPIEVRVGLHTGTPLLTEEGYVGEDVHFAARVAAASHGGQVVLSSATAELVEPAVTDLGEHRLKDVAEPVSIFQLGDRSFPPLKTISNTNLPRPASSFVGREVELAEVLSRIEAGTRLLTLTGPGGTGKTRLALEVATSLVPDYRAGVFWVGLASLRDPGLVTETIAQTLGAKDSLAEHIGERELLLLLDNLEQVIEVAPELSALLQSCPNLTLLVTSRELLRIQGEVEYSVPPLAEPEAISLFCERSQLEPSEEIAELCARLDSLPLAVELAAARTKALTPDQILERLSQRLDLHTGGRDADPRQLTLRTTIEWSYELLSPTEQQLYARSSVFAGGCTLEAAEEVAEADLDTLQSLVEKSLVRFSNARYWMLETIREFAAERLEASGEAPTVAAMHGGFFVELANRNPRDPGLADLLELERDNMRGAMAWSLSEGRFEDAHRLAIAYGFLSVSHGPLSEGRSWLGAVLQHTSGVPAALRQRALQRATGLAERQGDLGAARALAEESLAAARAIGDPEAIGSALLSLGVVEGSDEDMDRAEMLHREALEVFSANGNDSQVRMTLGLLGWLAIARGDYSQAQEFCEEALRMARDAGDMRSALHAVSNLGHALARTGRLEEALGLQREALLIAQEIDPTAVADTLIEIASVAVERSDYEPAAVLAGASAALHEATESKFDRVGLVMFEDVVQVSDGQLGSDHARRLTIRGRKMTSEECVAFALGYIDHVR